jgi:hypothetical protein
MSERKDDHIEKRGAAEVVYITSAALVAANQAVDLAGKLKAKMGTPRSDPQLVVSRRRPSDFSPQGLL